MKYSLKLITPPAIEPVTVDEAKLHAHINHDVEDTLIAKWIKSGRELAEGFHRRAYIHQVWEMGFDCFPDLPIVIARTPMVQPVITPDGVTTTTPEPGTTIPEFSLKYYDYLNAEGVVDPADLIIDINSEPARITLGYDVSWPSVTLRLIDAVRLRFTAGYGAAADSVPENVKDAIMLYCTYRNEGRAGESGPVPDSFYDLLWPDRNF